MTGLVYNTSSLVWYYFAGDLSNEVQVTMATATLGTWTSGGFVEVDATNMPGWYEIGIPNAALDGGIECAMQLRGAANMVPVNVYIELDAFDYQTATQTVNVTQFGGTNGTFSSGVPTAALDPASITAVQSGLATASALATTHALLQLTDTDVAAIEARLPSDPADQSAVEAAITAATSPLATSSALSTAAGNITTILGKFTGITLLARWLGALAGKTADTTTRTEINATTAGAGYNETTDSQEAIRDRGDASWITGSGGGGGGTTTIVTLQAAAGISPGVIVGPSEPLVIGDDYLTVMNRSVRINLLDANGDPAEVEYGTYALDDDGISIQMLLAKSGKPSVEALIVGTCNFFPAVGDVPPYLIVEFTRTETAKAIPGPYDMQVEAVWDDGKTVTFAPYGQIQFVRNIGRRS